jgi:hypothetical protein
MKKVVFTLIVAVAMLFTGCTTKQTDSQGVKIAKGVVNAPGYALIGVAAATQFVAGAALSPFIWVGEQLGDSNSTDSNATSLDQNVTALDLNTSVDSNSTKEIEVWEESNEKNNN